MTIPRITITIILAVSFLLVPQTVFALAPEPADIYIQATPAAQDVPPGGSLTFKITVLPQGPFEGKVQLALLNPPAGITASIEPNPVNVPAFGEGEATLTVKVAPDVAQSKIALKLNGKAVEQPRDKPIDKTTEITLNIVAATTTTTTKPTTSTTTTTTTTTPSTTTKTTPTTTKTSTTPTTTTSTSRTTTTTTPTTTTSTSAGATGFPAELTYWAVGIIVIIIIVAAVFTLRKRK